MKKILIIIMMLVTVVATSQGYSKPLFVKADFPNLFTAVNTFDTGGTTPIKIERTNPNVNIKFTAAGVGRHLGLGDSGNLTWGVGNISSLNDIIFHEGNLNKSNVDFLADKITTVTLNLTTLPVFADDTAAASLSQGDVYRTSTGELRIKL
jgi:hypothetical protein